MKLQTDAIYFWAVVLFAASLFGGAWLAQRVKRSMKGFILTTFVMLLSTILSVLGLALVLNRSNGWYATMNDLWAAPIGQASDAGNVDNVYGKELDRDKEEHVRTSLPPLPSPGKRIQTFQVPTSVGHRVWEVTVILPKNYDPESLTRYPVMMALHGFPGNPSVYLPGGRMDIIKLTDHLVEDTKVAPFIAVLPNTLPGSQDTECIFGPDGPHQLETWLAKDVPRFVEEHLRARSDRASWATMGFSFGGWCAPMLTMLHPDRFGAAISMSGYFRPQWVAKPPFDKNGHQARQYDLIEAVGQKPPVAVWIQAGENDRTVWPTAKEFIETAPKHGMFVTSVVDPTGGHSWTLWVPRVSESVSWLGTHVPGFHP